MPAQTVLPRWRGFMLPDMIYPDLRGDWHEEDFQWIREFGFDYIAVPVNYKLLWEKDDLHRFHRPGLEKLDRGIELCRRHGLHMCLNLYNAPGWDTATHEWGGKEWRGSGSNLFKDQGSLDTFCFQWTTVAERYREVPTKELSFHLLNEPPEVETSTIFSPAAPTVSGNMMSLEDYDRVHRALAAAVRKGDPTADRVILCDGLNYGFSPRPELADLGIAQCCRGFWPHTVSHYQAWGAIAEPYPEAVWPNCVERDGQVWNRQTLEEHYRSWAELAEKGVGVLAFEIGAYNKTPHQIALAWLRDVLDILTRLNIGYVVWTFRGSFGIMDSGREDVEYEDFHGHGLDRKMLSLLQEF